MIFNQSQRSSQRVIRKCIQCYKCIKQFNICVQWIDRSIISCQGSKTRHRRHIALLYSFLSSHQTPSDVDTSAAFNFSPFVKTLNFFPSLTYPDEYPARSLFPSVLFPLQFSVVIVYDIPFNGSVTLNMMIRALLSPHNISFEMTTVSSLGIRIYSGKFHVPCIFY